MKHSLLVLSLAINLKMTYQPQTILEELQTKIPNTTNNTITECYMCLEDFYEFEENYFQCDCGEKTCLSCINYKIKTV